MALHRIYLYQRTTVPLNETMNVWLCGNSSSTFADAEISLGVLLNWYGLFFKPFLPATWELYDAAIQNVSVPGMPIVPVSVGTAITGTAGLALGPTQISAVVNFRSYTARPNRARKFIGPLSEQAATNSVLDTGTMDALDAFCLDFNDFQQSNSGGNITFASGRWNPALGIVSPANELSVATYSPVPGSLRSRKLLVGS